MQDKKPSERMGEIIAQRAGELGFDPKNIPKSADQALHVLALIDYLDEEWEARQKRIIIPSQFG